MLRVCVALLALLAITACSDSESDPEAESAEPSATETPVDVAPYVETPTGPVGLTATEDGAVWVVGAQSETVLRIPAGATEPDLTIDVPGMPLRTTAAYGSVWVTSFDGKSGGDSTRPPARWSRRSRPAPGRRACPRVRLDLGGRPGRRQAAAHRPRHQRGQRRGRAEVGARLVKPGPDAMYVAHYADDLILRVDPKTNALTTSEAVCDGPQAMAVIDGKVWVTCTLSDELIALDAATLQKVGVGADRGLTRLGHGHRRRPARRRRRGGSALVVVDPAPQRSSPAGARRGARPQRPGQPRPRPGRRRGVVQLVQRGPGVPPAATG